MAEQITVRDLRQKLIISLWNDVCFSGGRRSPGTERLVAMLRSRKAKRRKVGAKAGRHPQG